MSAQEPRTVREALAGLVLEELDGLTGRVELLMTTVNHAAQGVNSMSDALTAASDNFRLSVTAFTEQAKVELTSHLERKAEQVGQATAAEVRGLLIGAAQAAAQEAFKSEAGDRAAALGKVLTSALIEFRSASRSRYIEHAFTAGIASFITAGLVWFLK
jgi:orotidine-5'-phosphate decarboxylase